MTYTVLSLRRAWSGLVPPAPEEVVGDLRASFVAPLRTVAPRGLGLIGLPRWYGKRFRREGASVTGVNLLRSPGHSTGGSTGELVETLPMQVQLGVSLADDLPALVVTYPKESPRPWPWVRDELRVLPDGTILGMTFVDLPGLRRTGGTPFLLTRT
ncbi:hypothetical protein JK386_03845 [Nocardioides sp. zg-536]|uniref:Uncharacterized protein n=1 Tax=Nocardioides faecalis TaxID=2803858 RepID=A0A938Y6B2_9ACTN|nr:hypothetical protein [Nocardioides faecalis]MBM9459023.1 hypothetical protein [Nocardioides faecalis]QVI57290.1 hypothetical protein KG111_09105 [Nocardioides faecalis]